MSDPVSLFDPVTAPVATATVQIFDSPMCCPTGVCGPAVDQTLLDVGEMILSLQAGNVSVERYQMTGHPDVFLNNPDVMRLVREQQMAALPITLVHGRVVKVGAYPTLEEIKINLNGAFGQ